MKYNASPIGIYAFFAALTWLAIAFLTHGFWGTEGFFYDLPNKRMPFGRFFLFYTIAFALYSFAVVKIKSIPAGRRNLVIVLAGAFVFRLILIPSIPVHENDIYRYIWDGKILTNGINPYKYPPMVAGIKPAHNESQADFEKLKSIRDENPKFYRRISYKDVPTIYPPLTQAVFSVSTLAAPGSVWFMKFLFVLFDMGVIFLICGVLKLLKQNPLYAIIYAWNPLVLKEFANSGHYDALAICCVTAAVYLGLKKKYHFSSVCLGLGVLSKFYPLIFMPFFILKKQYSAFFICLAVIVLGYFPFYLWGETDLLSIFTGLGIYAHKWAINGFVFELINSLLLTLGKNFYILSKIICACIFVAIWLLIYSSKRDIIEKMFWSVTALFLLSPVGDPWYYCWMIPFLCIYRNYSLIALSYLLILSYFEFTRDFGAFRLGEFEIDNLLLLQYIPFYLFFLIESWFGRKRGPAES